MIESDKLAVRSCVVCGMSDARGLVATRLEGGETTTLCGSHQLAYNRSRPRPRDVAELVARTKNRRDRTRRSPDGDELGAQLSAAFAGDRRQSVDRRGM